MSSENSPASGQVGPASPRGGSATREVFVAFLRLGLTSFGGTVAHLGYFREAFVVRRRWLGDHAYADLVALCQFLPGPASSQVGMAIGLHRAGIGGLLAAWAGFTLPSAVLLVAFAYGVTVLGGDAGAGWIGGLKAAAVAVVAQAVLGMTRTLAPDARRATVAAGAAIVTLLAPSVLGLPVALSQVGVIVLAGVAGLLWLAAPADDGDAEPFAVPVRRGAAVVCLSVFGVLLVALPLVAAASGDGVARLVDVFYRAGSLVFGGGHVVLPLLQAETVPSGLVGHDQFLAGYGAAQAVPGPLFTFAAYLGAVTTSGPTGVAGATIALVAIFVPSVLLVVGALPFWECLRGAPRARRALMGVNAGVVGLLAAALYDPVFTQGVLGTSDPLVALALAVAAFVALAKWSAPPWAVVIAAGLLGWVVL